MDTETGNTGQGAPAGATSRASTNSPRTAPRAYTLAELIDAFMAAYAGADRGIGARLAYWSQALGHAEAAVGLSGEDPLILAVLGAVNSLVGNQGSARAMLERAVQLDPNGAWAWSRLGWVENYSDSPERAIEWFQRAIRLSPLDPMNFNNQVGIGAAHLIAERYDEAISHYRRGMQERPNAKWLLRGLTAALVGAGRAEEAKIECARLLAYSPGLTVAKVRDAMPFSSAMLDRLGRQLKAAGLPD